MEGKTGARGASRAALHVLFSVPLATFAFSYFSAGLMELLRPVGPPSSACLAVVSDCLDDRKFMFLLCTALLVLVAGDSRVVTSSGPGTDAGFMGDGISRGGYVWLAPGTLDGGAGALGGRTGLPGVGLPETLAVEVEERADELEEEVEVEVAEEGNEEEDGEGGRDEQREEEGGEEEGRKEEEQEGEEGEEEVDGEEFRRKCEDFIEKVKRERVKEALHLLLA